MTLISCNPRGITPTRTRRTVLVVHQHAVIGGAENSIELWVTHMPPWMRPIIVLGGPGPLLDRLKSKGVDTRILDFPALRPWNVPSISAAIARLVLLTRREGADLLHSNTPRTNFYCGLAGRIAGAPVIWHERNLIYHGMKDLDRWLSFLPTRIVAISKAVESRFHVHGAPIAKVETLYNAVDTQAFSPSISGRAFREEFGLRAGQLAVGLVGRLGLGKGHDVFLQAAKVALSGGSAARFFVVGGPQDEQERSIAADLALLGDNLGIGPRVTWTGMRKDIPAVMAGLDIVVLCTESEPLGRVVLEGMAAGRAVVATRAGGVPELIAHDQTGLLFTPGNAEELGRIFVGLERDPERRARLGQAARQRALAEFSLDRHVERMTDLYRRTFRQDRPSQRPPHDAPAGV